MEQGENLLWSRSKIHKQPVKTPGLQVLYHTAQVI